MSDYRSKGLIAKAKKQLAASATPPWKLGFCHVGVSAAASILVTVVAYLCQTATSSADGLSALGTQAILETVELALSALVSALTTFWSVGFCAVALQLVRRQNPTCRTFLTGFYRWWSILWTVILQGLLAFLLIYGAMIVGMLVYVLTPASSAFWELAEQTAGLDTAAAILETLDDAALMDLMYSMLPFLLIPAALVMIPFFYFMRLSNFVLMDEPRCGAFRACWRSVRLAWGNFRKLIAMDLHYWWYHLLTALLAVVAYGDVILSVAGVTVAMDATVLSLLFYGVSILGQVLLFTWKKPQVMTSYALVYDHLKAQKQM